MAGAVRGGLRPHHPAKHSFILVGLIVVLIVLGINYWSTSAKNYRLLAEVAKLQKNYKLCAEQFGQLSGEKKRQENTANEKDRELEDTRRHLVDKEAEVGKLRSVQNRHEDELEQCRNNVTALLRQSHIQLETCEDRVEKVKVEQQEACSQQVQTALDQLKHEHVLDKRKAIEEALQLARKRQQQAEQAQQSAQQKTVRQKHYAQQQLVAQWKQKVQGSFQQQETDHQAEWQQQQQFEPVNQQQKQFPVQQQQPEKELPQRQNRQPQERRQDALQQLPAEPVQLPQDQSLQRQQNSRQKQFPMQQQLPEKELPEQRQNMQPQEHRPYASRRRHAELPQEQSLHQQQNSQQKQFDEGQQQRGVQQQLAVRRQRSVLHGALQQKNEMQPLGTYSQQNEGRVLQYSLPNKPDQQHPYQISQVVMTAPRKAADDEAQVENQRQSMNQEPQQSDVNNQQQQQEQQQQQQQQPLIYQVPAPAHVKDYKQAADERLPKHDVPAPLPDWKHQHIDVYRQQQFEQFQQDKLREHLQTQKENGHARPLMVPQQSEDQPSLLGNAREPPHLEGVIHVTGAIMASGIKDVAVRAPDGSMGQIDSVRNDQLGQQGIAPGFENMPVAGPANENVNRIANDGPGNVRDESQRDYVNQKDTEQKAKDQAVDEDEYPDDKDNENRAQQPDEKPRDRR